MNTLRRLHLVERLVPATERYPERSRRGLYVLKDNYLRFYFRFIAPNQHLLERGQVDRLWGKISDQLPAFVGITAFEELCREWVWAQVAAEQLPFLPNRVGAYWDRRTQTSSRGSVRGIDVVAIGWDEQAILLGEAKWTTRPVGVPVLEGLKKKAASATPGTNWAVHYTLFSRSGFSPSLERLAADEGVRLVSLEEIITSV